MTRTPTFERRIPAGDEHHRLVCTDCGFVQYENPKVVVGSVVHAGERILMCRRAIEPRAGFWTLPAGYLEVHEMPEAGALREAWEEAQARIDIEMLLAVYTIPRISQVQLIFRARLAAPEIAAGPESLEVALFAWDEIPWKDIAFPTVRWALHDFAETRGETTIVTRRNPPGQVGDD